MSSGILIVLHTGFNLIIIITRIDCIISTNCLNLMILVWLERRGSYLPIYGLTVNFAALDGKLQPN